MCKVSNQRALLWSLHHVMHMTVEAWRTWKPCSGWGSRCILESRVEDTVSNVHIPTSSCRPEGDRKLCSELSPLRPKLTSMSWWIVHLPRSKRRAKSNTSAPTFIPSTLTFGAPLSIQEPKPSATPNEPSVQPVKGAAASGSDIPVVKIDQPPRPDLHSVGRSSNSAPPPPPPSSNLDAPWNANVDQAPTMILQRQAVNPAESASIDFAEPNPVSELSFQTQVWYVQA